MSNDTQYEELRRVDLLAKIISDADIARVHGNANFGDMSPREVVNDGVRKYAIGFHGGHTQVCILREHGLITKSRGMSYDANLTKKGKAYARVLYTRQKSELAALLDDLQAKTEALRAAEADARRYRYLRSRDPGPDGELPSAGMFIGQVPENLILTEADADEAIDAALEPKT